MWFFLYRSSRSRSRERKRDKRSRSRDRKRSRSIEKTSSSKDKIKFDDEKPNAAEEETTKENNVDKTGDAGVKEKENGTHLSEDEKERKDDKRSTSESPEKQTASKDKEYVYWPQKL